MKTEPVSVLLGREPVGEHPVEVLGRNPDAGVGDRYPNAVAVLLRSDRELALAGRLLERLAGVGQVVDDDLHDLVAIDRDRRRGVELLDHLDPLADEAGLVDVEGCLDDLVERDRLLCSSGPRERLLGR